MATHSVRLRRIETAETFPLQRLSRSQSTPVVVAAWKIAITAVGFAGALAFSDSLWDGGVSVDAGRISADRGYPAASLPRYVSPSDLGAPLATTFPEQLVTPVVQADVGGAPPQSSGAAALSTFLSYLAGGSEPAFTAVQAQPVGAGGMTRPVAAA